VGGIFDYQDGQLYRGPQQIMQLLSIVINQPQHRAAGKKCLCKQLGSIFTFLLAYVERRRSLEYGDRERNFQLYRRGRYVEFNLVYDRGTILDCKPTGALSQF